MHNDIDGRHTPTNYDDCIIKEGSVWLFDAERIGRNGSSNDFDDSAKNYYDNAPFGMWLWTRKQWKATLPPGLFDY